MLSRLLLIAAVAIPAPITAQATMVFKGRPSVQIATAGADPKTKLLQEEQAESYDCVISMIDNEYYWATRENRRMVLIESGAYLIYVAVDGSGYVKVLKPEMKAVAALTDDSAARFDYVEHLPVGLSSITYYGERRPF